VIQVGKGRKKNPSKKREPKKEPPAKTQKKEESNYLVQNDSPEKNFGRGRPLKTIEDPNFPTEPKLPRTRPNGNSGPKAWGGGGTKRTIGLEGKIREGDLVRVKT